MGKEISRRSFLKTGTAAAIIIGKLIGAGQREQAIKTANTFGWFMPALAVVVALTLDEKGIPETAEGRLAIAEKIIAEAAKYGIARKNIIVDPLAMAVSADKNAANITLSALKQIREKLGVHTSLGKGLPISVASSEIAFIPFVFASATNKSNVLNAIPCLL